MTLVAEEGGAEDDGLCPSMYSFHSSAEEKNKLLATLSECGIETTVDRGAKKDRIRQWIQSAAIPEDDEEAESEAEQDSWEEDAPSRTRAPRQAKVRVHMVHAHGVNMSSLRVVLWRL